MSDYALAMKQREDRIAELRAKLLETLPADVAAGTRALTLEIGCGHGHFLAAYAAAFPQEFCVGLDLISKRIERANRKRELAGLANLAFFKAEATELLLALPEKCRLGKIFFLFPDPWPKKRHHKNRLIQTEMLDRLAARSVAGTRLHFRTDHAEYFEWSRELVSAHPRWRPLPDAPWPFEHETYFQSILPDAYRSLVAEAVFSADPLFKR